MNRLVGTAFAVAALALAGVAQAAPGDNGNGIGGCIDSLYGNATNPRPSGNGVLPSQSPDAMVTGHLPGSLPDEYTGGLHAGDLFILAARPSMGKTAFALNIAEHVALHPSVRLPVAIFSMEMSGSQLAMRMLSSIAKVDAHKLRTGRLADEEWSQLTDAMGRLHEAKIHVDETAALNALEVRARARRLKREYSKLGLVIVDYLQLMSASTHGENRATEISEISR